MLRIPVFLMNVTKKSLFHCYKSRTEPPNALWEILYRIHGSWVSHGIVLAFSALAGANEEVCKEFMKKKKKKTPIVVNMIECKVNIGSLSSMPKCIKEHLSVCLSIHWSNPSVILIAILLGYHGRISPVVNCWT